MMGVRVRLVGAFVALFVALVLTGCGWVAGLIPIAVAWPLAVALAVVMLVVCVGIAATQP